MPQLESITFVEYLEGLVSSLLTVLRSLFRYPLHTTS